MVRTVRATLSGDHMRKALGFVLLLAVVGVVAVGTLVGLRLADIRLPFTTETIDRSEPALLTSIQDVDRYDAAVGNFQVVVDTEDDVAYVPGFIAGQRSLFVASGSVDAYVDLSVLAEGDLTVSEERRTVEIELPAAELDSPNLDQEATRLFSQDRGVLDRVGDALSTPDQQDLYVQAEQKIADAAAASELRERAEQNTRAMLTGMLGALDYEVTVSFAEGPRPE